MAEFNYNSPIIQNIFGMNSAPQYGGYPNGYPQQSPPNTNGYMYTPYSDQIIDFVNPFTKQLNYNPYSQFEVQASYNPYYGNYNNYYGNNGYGYNNGYYNAYNQYNQQLNDNLYGAQQPGGYDVYSSRNIGYPKEESNNAVTVPYDYVQYGYYDYYGNYRNPYMTPAEIKQYQDEMQRQYQEAVRQEIERNKRLSRIAHRAIGEEIPEETLELMYNPAPPEPAKLSPEEMKRKMEDEEVIKTMSVCALGQYVEAAEQYQRSLIYKEQARVTEAHNKFINPDSTLEEFLENAGKLYIESLMNKQKYQRAKDNMQYDSDAYKAMIKARNPLSNITLDDNVVSLPKGWRSDYQQQRARFMDAIINSNRVGNPNG